MKNAIPSAALAQHIAFLGKTGSGKTSTAKLAVEQILRDDPAARVCVLDPIKSDWWGLTSSASGKRAGLPFHILGGPRGHVPLHPAAGKAIGELVATGALPLSIIDMADFPLGGLQEFFNEFAPALLRKMRGVVHLVIEEAHEFAPKERAGFGGESMTMHYAKKLATAGRSRGIRMMVLTQRTQALHNALLGSCDTMIAHRLTAPADQEPVKKWLKANVSKELEKVAGHLAKLRTGTGWICSGEAQVVELVEFPKITTYDNSATPTGNDAGQDVTTAPVDRDKLRAILGTAVEEAKADHVPTLKARIGELEAEVAKVRGQGANISAADQRRVYDDGHRDGYGKGFRDGREDGSSGARKMYGERIDKHRQAIVNAMSDLVAPMPLLPPLESTPSPAPASFTPSTGGTGDRFYRERPPAAPRAAAAPPAEGLTGPMQRILDALAWWAAVGVAAPTRLQVAVVARYNPDGGAFNNPLGALRTAGLVDYPGGGMVILTAEGSAKANAPGQPPNTQELHDRVLGILNGPQRRILEPLLGAYPRSMSKEELAAAAGYEPTGGAFNNPLGSLRSLGFVAKRGEPVALPVLFVE